MDKLDFYRQQIQNVIHEYASYKPKYGEVEVEEIIDTVKDHYQVLSNGWNDQTRIHGCLLHIDIRNNKIWIQHDGTEEGVAGRFVAAGIPPKDIVLAFHSPYKRQFTQFAVE